MSVYQVRRSMESAGFTNLATTLGLKALMNKNMLTSFEDSDRNDNSFMSYRVTDLGMSWLFQNQDTLTLRRQEYDPSSPPEKIPF